MKLWLTVIVVRITLGLMKKHLVELYNGHFLPKVWKTLSQRAKRSAFRSLRAGRETEIRYCIQKPKHPETIRPIFKPTWKRSVLVLHTVEMAPPGMAIR
jgi:hypothetical protein